MTFLKYFKSTFSQPQKLTVKIALTLLTISSPLLLSNSTLAQTSGNLSQSQQIQNKDEINKIDAALKKYNSQNVTDDDKRKAIGVFRENLKNPDIEVRIAATNVLKSIGTGADEALGDLKNLLKTEKNSDVFDSAIAAIQSINATPAIPELIDISMNESKGLQVRSTALEALATVAENIDREQAEKVIPFLLDSLEEQSVNKINLRISAASALSKMYNHLPSYEKKAVPILIDSVKDTAWQVRRVCC